MAWNNLSDVAVEDLWIAEYQAGRAHLDLAAELASEIHARLASVSSFLGGFLGVERFSRFTAIYSNKGLMSSNVANAQGDIAASASSAGGGVDWRMVVFLVLVLAFVR